MAKCISSKHECFSQFLCIFFYIQQSLLYGTDVKHCVRHAYITILYSLPVYKYLYPVSEAVVSYILS